MILTGVKVIRIERLEGARIERELHGFRVQVVYQLENGIPARHYFRGRLRKEVAAKLKVLPQPVNNLYVDVCDDAVIQIHREQPPMAKLI